jgi:serine/threonine-protein kinase
LRDTKKSLASQLQYAPLVTDIGNFDYVQQIGQGGNALVFSFKKGSRQFAIKFLESADKGKLSRFKDEFFCTMQISTHKNIARSYHFDTVDFGGVSYSLIVMRKYEGSLAKQGHISSVPEEEKAECGLRLLNSLMQGLNHLHKNGIIHRDIKPENIFYDDEAKSYVIGDLGIAHFSVDAFSREAKTTTDERLANFKYSAPEQVEGKGPPTPAWDIYAMGQVVSWYLYDELVRGMGRTRYSGENQNLALIDSIVDRCLQNSPKIRFASIDDILSFVKEWKTPKRDTFQKIHDLDTVIRMSLPDIKKLYETTSQKEISRFVRNFSSICQADEFWYIKSDGSDMSLNALDMMESGRCLLAGSYELKIDKLICYKHPSEWRSFFIILAAADTPFDIVDFDGLAINRAIPVDWKTDVAALYNGRYVDPQRLQNSYYEHNDEIHKVDWNKTEERERILKPTAFLICPQGTGPNAVQYTVNAAFLSDVVEQNSVNPVRLSSYLEATLPFASREITDLL